MSEHEYDNSEVEFWEHHYLNQIEFTLTQDLKKMLDGLRSKDKIKKDWIEVFHRQDKKHQNSDFSRGAERIYYWLFNQFGIPNSAPIGADMFFETYNAFVHIDIKTAKFDNPADYRGRIPIGANQTSYKVDNFNYEINLPYKYSFQNKLCLTYFINIIYEVKKYDIKIKAIVLISVPNGKLVSVYGKSIIKAGKTGMEGKGFRYSFKNNHVFKLLRGNETRVKIIYLSEGLSSEIILGYDAK